MPAPPETSSAGAVRVGIGGWQYAPWRHGHFYPEGLRQKDELAYASRHVTAIEINGTFYRTPQRAHYAAWREATPEGFKFSQKAPRRIVQQRLLAHTGDDVARFIDGGLAELGDRLGPIVWQFGVYKHFDPDDMGAFLEQLPSQVEGLSLQHVLEVRHASFVDTAFLAMARRHGVALVGTDSAEHPSFFDLSGPLAYLRLMQARADEPCGYPTAEITTWRARAQQWAQGDEPTGLPRIDEAPASAAHGGRDVYVFFINGAKEHAPAAAQAWLQTAPS